MALRFFYEDIGYKLPHARQSAAWIANSIKKEKASIREISYIFCTDPFLLKINKKYLNHDTLTDIITFDYSEKASKALLGDIYISIDRVADNAEKFDKPFIQELHRVMIHGILHLIGYNDKKASEKALMRKKEEAYLSLRK